MWIESACDAISSKTMNTMESSSIGIQCLGGDSALYVEGCGTGSLAGMEARWPQTHRLPIVFQPVSSCLPPRLSSACFLPHSMLP